jgi:predicted DNA-binding protein YlxM (UPF0122 family)
MVMLYCAVIGDIIGSRRLTDRSAVQEKFLALAAKASSLYKADIASPFTVTIGDEFQVLLRNVDSAPAIIEYTAREMTPVGLVFGVGIGAIITDINPSLAIGMDGPAFHFARRAIEQAKKKKPGIIYQSDFPGMDMINALNYFIESCTKRRTKRQQQVLTYLHENYTQEEIAARLGIKQQSVFDIINAAYLSEVESAKRSIALYLQAIGSQSENSDWKSNINVGM